MQLTTINIIKILPLEEVFKAQLLKQYASLNADQKFAIEQLVWNGYADFFELKLQENIRLALEQAKNKNGKLDKGFYDRVRAQTEQEIQEFSTATTAKIDLTSTREKLEELMKKNPQNS